LTHYRETMTANRESLDPHLLTLLGARLDICQNYLLELKGILANLTPELAPTYEKLVSILRTLCACNVKPKVRTQPNAQLMLISPSSQRKRSRVTKRS
jgi:hypothetical protein